MNDKKVSIIIPVYNVEEYLSTCLDSLIKQSYKNLEIILVDDGSLDQSPTICDDYEKRDSRIHVIHKRNQGVSEARNSGLQIASGDYIAFSDPDDWVEPIMIEQMVKGLEQRNADVIYCCFQIETEEGGPPKKNDVPEDIEGDKRDSIAKLFIDGYGTMVWNKLFRRNCIYHNVDDFIRFPKGMKCGEDEIWLLQVLQNVKRAVYLKDRFYHWRVRKESAYRLNKVTDSRIHDVMAQEQALSYIDKEDKDTYDFVMRRLNKKAYDFMVYAYIQGEKSYYLQLKKYSDKYKKYWYDSKIIKKPTKIKRRMIELAMNLHLSKKIVSTLKRM